MQHYSGSVQNNHFGSKDDGHWWCKCILHRLEVVPRNFDLPDCLCFPDCSFPGQLRGLLNFMARFELANTDSRNRPYHLCQESPSTCPSPPGNRWVTASMFTRTNPITNPMTFLLWFAKAICYFQCLMFVPATFTQFTPFRLQWTLWLLWPAWPVSCSILALRLGAAHNPQPATKESPNEEDPWGHLSHLSHLSHLPNHRWTGSRSF